MRKSIFSKISVMVLLFCSIVVMSACSVFQKDNVNITGIRVLDKTVPTYILAQEGAFDDAEIKLEVSYSDNTKKEIAITLSMVPDEYQDELLTPGEYDIKILFRGYETVLRIRVAEVTNVYTVKFFNGNNDLIAVQYVNEGEDATAPASGLVAISGFEFMGWDRDFTNVTEDINVYASYIKVEDILTDEVLEEKFFNAINNTMTTSHTSTVVDYELALEGEGAAQLMLANFHYNKDSGEIEAQIKAVAEGELYGYLEIKDNYASMLMFGEEVDYSTVGSISNEEIYSTLQMPTIEFINDLIIECPIVEYSYFVAGNKTIYSCSFSDGDHYEYIYCYDNENILSYQYYNFENLSRQVDYVYADEEVSFEDWSDIFDENVAEKVEAGKEAFVQACNNLLSYDMVIDSWDYMDYSQINIKYDHDNKVVAKYNVDRYTEDSELVYVEWEDGEDVNSYDGETYSNIDRLLSFIPNFESLIESDEIYIGFIEAYIEDMHCLVVELYSDNFGYEIEIINGVITTIYGEDFEFDINYEDVEISLPDDILNKEDNAELRLENILEAKFFNAINNTMTTSHTSTAIRHVDEGVTQYDEMQFNNFHYNAETGEIEAQTKVSLEGEVFGYLEFKNDYGTMVSTYDGGKQYTIGYIGDNDSIYVTLDIPTVYFINDLFEEAVSVEYDSEVVNGNNIYYCTINLENAGIAYVYSYDNTRVLSYKHYLYNFTQLQTEVEYIYSEEEVLFEDWSDIIPNNAEEIINTEIEGMLEAYSSLLSNDIVINVYEYRNNGNTYSIKYDYDNKVVAEYNNDDALVYVEWEDGEELNSYDGEIYSEVDRLLAFIPNLKEMLGSNREDVFVTLTEIIMGEQSTLQIYMSSPLGRYEVEIVNGVITSIMNEEEDTRYNINYEDVEISLPDDILNKEDNAELNIV